MRFRFGNVQRDPSEGAALLRERVYVTFTAIAVIIAMRGHVKTVREAVVTLVIAVLGTVLAGMVADLIAHSIAHQHAPARPDVMHIVAIAASGLLTLTMPMIIMLGARHGMVSLPTALSASLAALIGTLSLLAFVAFRPLKVARWKKLVAMGVLVALACVILALELALHH